MRFLRRNCGKSSLRGAKRGSNPITTPLLLCLSALLLSVNFNVYGNSTDVAKAGVDSFKYDTAGRRDPFVPLVTKGGKIAFGYGTIRSIEDIRLEGIVYDPSGDSIAVINGMVLKENDTIGNIKFIKIEFDKVSLLFNQTKHVIHLAE
ncbi:MAG: hypothetical protein JSW18_04635 [Candidatus Omnitrophota bacterium]|nr:MAG: hypothetical protein JSW18_04635 [Candidatus Omnitrophota bacterium]